MEITRRERVGIKRLYQDNLKETAPAKTLGGSGPGRTISKILWVQRDLCIGQAGGKRMPDLPEG